MVRACLPCLLLLFMVASTISLYQGGYYPTAVRYPAPTALSYDGFYGRTSYPTNTYRPTTYSRTSYPATSYPTSSYVPAYSALIKNSYSTGSNIPLCKAGGEMLLKVFVEKDYKPVLNAKVSYVDNKGLKTVSTNQYGLASLTVYGCSVALMVYHKEDNPVYRTVDLLSCTTRTEKVVINVDDKCNFNLKFTNTDNDIVIESGDEHQIISIIYDSSYDHTGHEEVVAKTACITAGQVGDKLKVVIKSQYSNIFNVLETTITSDRAAVMARPPQLDDDKKQFDIVVISNAHVDDYVLCNHFRFRLKADDDTLQENQWTVETHFYGGFYEGVLAGRKWLLFGEYPFTIKDPNDPNVPKTVVAKRFPYDFKGNVMVSDCDGNYQSIEHPDNGEDYTYSDSTDPVNQNRPEMLFLVGCFCNNVPSMKVGDFFAIGKYVLPSGTGTGSITSDPYATHCAPICDANPPSTY